MNRPTSALPSWAKAAVITAEGDHFSAGLDFDEMSERNAFEGVHHSRMWHAAFAKL
ncbi:hypothetical protein [Streptomyces griseorubiginosus]|uniref:hypothetical protein n=1 Tax=Streptomyces griseorubiginosus TaxID=67304 RepID=UPI0033D673F7